MEVYKNLEERLKPPFPEKKGHYDELLEMGYMFIWDTLRIKTYPLYF